MSSSQSRRDFLAGASCATLFLALPACGNSTQSSGHDKPPMPLTKGPWVSLTSATSARLRFETLEARAASVTLRFDGTSQKKTPALSQKTLTYHWADALVFSAGAPPDAPGLHVLQDVAIEGLTPGQTYQWEVNLGGGDVRKGSFRAPPPASDAVRIGWIADTMYPAYKTPIASLLDAAPDVVVHGGDIQYQTNPIDTWNGLFQAMSGLNALAPLQIIVGNHEFESENEIQVMFDRLTGGQWGSSDKERYGSFRYGPALVVCLDSESSGLEDPTSAQRKWLEPLLENPGAKAVIVAFHRPLYTLSKYWRSDGASRDALHALFLKYGVRLVMSGHAHCYEHFLVDSVHYVVDGGGGALLYDPRVGAADVDAARPGESKLQLTALKSQGACTIDVAPDGSMNVKRLSASGADDAFSVTA